MWIESHQDLERHPKLFDLMASMNWGLDETIGRLHRFWWWCLSFAPDGNLSKHSAARLATSCGVKLEDSEKFQKAMIAAEWLDETPWLRVHDWWDYVGRYLKIKYKDAPHKWKSVQESYTDCGDTVGRDDTDPVTDPVTGGVTIPATQPTNQPTNRTDPPTRGMEDPSIETVLLWGQMDGVPKTVCEDFHRHWDGLAWMHGTAKIRNPRPWLKKWLNNSLRPGIGSPNRNIGTANEERANNYQAGKNVTKL